MTNHPPKPKTRPSSFVQSKMFALADIPKPSITDPYDVIIHIDKRKSAAPTSPTWQRWRIGDFVLGRQSCSATKAPAQSRRIGSARQESPSRGQGAIDRSSVPHATIVAVGPTTCAGYGFFAATSTANGTLSKYYKTAVRLLLRLTWSHDGWRRGPRL